MVIQTYILDSNNLDGFIWYVKFTEYMISRITMKIGEGWKCEEAV